MTPTERAALHARLDYLAGVVRLAGVAQAAKNALPAVEDMLAELSAFHAEYVEHCLPVWGGAAARLRGGLEGAGLVRPEDTVDLAAEAAAPLED